MTRIDANFAPQRFLDGAEAAFRLIVAAFATGDRPTLHRLLSEDTYAAFEGAIAAREAAGHSQKTDIRSVESVTTSCSSPRSARLMMTLIVCATWSTLAAAW